MAVTSIRRAAATEMAKAAARAQRRDAEARDILRREALRPVMVYFPSGEPAYAMVPAHDPAAPGPDMVDMAGAARILGVSLSWLRKLRRAGRLPPATTAACCGRVYYRRRDIESFAGCSGRMRP